MSTAGLFRRYSKGEPIEDAGVTILAVKVAGDTTREQTYSVRRHCCGRPDTLTHFQIHRRKFKKRKLCLSCGAKAGAHSKALQKAAILAMKIQTGEIVAQPEVPKPKPKRRERHKAVEAQIKVDQVWRPLASVRRKQSGAER